jgi:hypothetical protein
MQDWRKQRAQRLQVPPPERRDGAKIRRVEAHDTHEHDAHEIDALPARRGDAARSVDAATIGIEQ